MHWLADLAHLFGGMFFVNAVPHLVSGTMGRAFQTPFAKPRGAGLSSAMTNVLWGYLNLVLASALVLHVGRFDLHSLEDACALGIGGLAMALFLALRFGPFNGGART